jgi:hypothetical protein
VLASPPAAASQVKEEPGAAPESPPAKRLRHTRAAAQFSTPAEITAAGAKAGPAVAVQARGPAAPVAARMVGGTTAQQQGEGPCEEVDLFGESDGEQDAWSGPQQGGPSAPDLRSAAMPAKRGPGRPRKQPAVQPEAGAALAAVAVTAEEGDVPVAADAKGEVPGDAPAGQQGDGTLPIKMPAAAAATAGSARGAEVGRQAGPAGGGVSLVVAKRLTPNDLKQAVVTLPTAAGAASGHGARGTWLAHAIYGIMLVQPSLGE